MLIVLQTTFKYSRLALYYLIVRSNIVILINTEYYNEDYSKTEEERSIPMLVVEPSTNLPGEFLNGLHKFKAADGRR